jgi:hypothetical protein
MANRASGAVQVSISYGQEEILLFTQDDMFRKRKLLEKVLLNDYLQIVVRIS